jgi:hypothetical protein
MLYVATSITLFACTAGRSVEIHEEGTRVSIQESPVPPSPTTQTSQKMSFENGFIGIQEGSESQSGLASVGKDILFEAEWDSKPKLNLEQPRP